MGVARMHKPEALSATGDEDKDRKKESHEQHGDDERQVGRNGRGGMAGESGDKTMAQRGTKVK